MVKISDYKFEVGDHVQIKDWDEMVDEFGVRRDSGNIPCKCSFTQEMKHLCGKDFHISALHGSQLDLVMSEEGIELREDGLFPEFWNISFDMIKPYTDNNSQPEINMSDWEQVI